MKKLFMIFVCALSMSCGLIGGGVDKYNTLVDKDENANRAWSDYESALQRRADMVPQLVAIVKGSAAHEHSTLQDVIEARASATQIKLDPKNDDFSNPEKVKQFAQAQQGLGTALSRLLVNKEAYPELQANKAFANLQIQIEGSENRLLRGREEYNKAAMEYNTELRHISGKLVNPITGKEFKPREYFHVEEDAKIAPKISF